MISQIICEQMIIEIISKLEEFKDHYQNSTEYRTDHIEQISIKVKAVYEIIIEN